MSKPTKRAVIYSILLTANAYIGQALNFILIFAFTRLLKEEDFGSLTSSQAKVLVWLMAIDLGLSNGLIGSLNASKKDEKDTLAIALRLLSRVLSLRVAGAFLGTMAIILLAYFETSHGGQWDKDQFLRGIAYTPYLLGYAIQQTFAPYLSFTHRQAQTVYAHLFGVVLCSLASLYLVFQGYGVAAILFSQSFASFLSALFLMWIIFVQDGLLRKISISAFEIKKQEYWKKLFQHSWPYAVVFAATTLWQRLDQILAVEVFGFNLGGKYALAVRIVAIPVMIFTAISVAIFPEFQRIGVDAPDKLEHYIKTATKFLFRYGLVLASVSLFFVSVVITQAFPKYEAAKELIPWFIPGVWAIWMYNFTYNALFAFHKYAINVIAHVLAVMIYLTSLLLLPNLFGLKGIALAYDCFALSLFLLTYMGLVHSGRLKLWTAITPFTPSEKEFLALFKHRIWRRS